MRRSVLSRFRYWGDPLDQDAFNVCKRCYGDALAVCKATDGKILNFPQCRPTSGGVFALINQGVHTCATLEGACKKRCGEIFSGPTLVLGTRNPNHVGASVSCRAACSDPAGVQKCAEDGIYNPSGSRDICENSMGKAKATRDKACLASGSPVAVAACPKISEATVIKETSECTSAFPALPISK